MHIRRYVASKLTPAFRSLFTIFLLARGADALAACPTTKPLAFVFANGVTFGENDAVSAQLNLNALHDKVSAPIAERGYIDTPQCVRYYYVLNHTDAQTDTLGDIIETYDLATSERVLQIWGWVANPSGAPSDFVQKIFSVEDSISGGDLSTQITEYLSFLPESSKLITIAHSEGNLFANIDYRELLLHGADPAKLAVISVATPTSFVAGDGRWTTLITDVVIASFSTSFPELATLPANYFNTNLCGDFLCHAFSATYLNGDRSGPKITADVIDALPTSQTIDQLNVTFLTFGGAGAPGTAVIPTQTLAQTFTAGMSGRLTQIDVGIYKDPNTVGDVRLDILPFSVFPAFNLGASVFTKVIPIGSIPLLSTTLTVVDVSAGSLSVLPGQQYAIVLSRSAGPSTSPWVVWQDSGFLFPYVGGSFFIANPATSTQWLSISGDHRFRTWVATTP